VIPALIFLELLKCSATHSSAYYRVTKAESPGSVPVVHVYCPILPINPAKCSK
jgi:hypothetical protein